MKKTTIMLLIFFALGITNVMAQGRTVSGKVIDSNTKQPIAGATIMVVGTQNGAYSMEEGKFSIANVQGAAKLEASFMGYTDVTVDLSAAQTDVTISIAPSAFQMDEVVVVAYGKADKKSLTGSVAVVSSDDIAERPVTSATSAIAGSAPGIQTVSSSGAPGSSPSIRIRGVGSINSSSSPLYVVDGIPYTGDISSISPDDIASMSVLKDAASTALYGSRASNGVILIQTKGGRKEKVQFDVKITEGIVFKAQPDYEVIGAEDFYKMAWEGLRNDRYFIMEETMDAATAYANENLITSNNYYNLLRDKDTKLQVADNQVVRGSDEAWTMPVIYPNSEIMPGYNDDLNWLDQVAGVGFRQNYNISASGGSEKASYFASLGYTDEKGYFEGTSFTRLTARLKADFTPVDWLKLGINVSPTLSDSDNPYPSSGMNNPWYFAREIAPIYPVHQHDDATGEYILVNGETVYDDGNGHSYADGTSTRIRGQNAGSHPLYAAQLNSKETSKLQLFAQTYAEIKLYKDLKFTVDASLNNNYTAYKSYDNPVIGDGVPNGRLYQSDSRNYDYNFKQMLEYDKQIGDHSINVLAGHEVYQSSYKSMSASKYTEQLENIEQMANFVEMISISGYSSKYRQEGYFARANYNYKSRYYLSASYRRDGTSKFSPDNRWGNFWSVGASWIISDEEFMSNAMWVDFLKLRVSYGTNGNNGGSSADRYQWMPLYYISSYGNCPSLGWSGDGTPDLTWETAGSLDVGVDFRLWNRFNGSVGFFNKSSDDLIFSVPRPYLSGMTYQNDNIGSMRNTGLEFAFDVDAIRSKDWVWNIGFNATWYKNVITKLPEENREDGIISGYQKLYEGHSIYDYWLKQFAYVDPQDGASVFYFDDSVTDTGDAKYTWDPASDPKQFEKDGVKYTKKSSEAVYDWSDSVIPDLEGGISTSLTWKNVSLSLLFTYRLGGKSVDAKYNSLNYSNFQHALSTDILNVWHQPGDVVDAPRFNPSNSSERESISNRNLISSSYFALQNVTLNYSFPKKIANKLSLSKLSVYASGENLFQISALQGFDATSSFNGYTTNARFESMAVVTFGVNVSF